MPDQFKGPEFLKKKYWKFKDFRNIVEKSVKKKTDKIPPKPEKQIPYYLERLIDILEKKKGVLKNLIFKKFIIRPENIFQKTIKEKEKIIKEQKESLELWFNYLTSSEAQNYPPEFRYWVFSEVLKLGVYDEKRRKFNKRDKTTIAPFPPLNQQALSIILDEILTKYQKRSSRILTNLQNEEEKEYFKNIIESENFNTLYGWALDYVKKLILPEERLPITIGEWREFKNVDEVENLISQISNFPTGWCIAGKPTAESYLSHSKILIYFSQDKNGNNTIPRLAIVINKQTDKITEIRGIAEGQNLDPYIISVLETKLKEMRGGEKYLQRVNDMKKLTEIHFKYLNNQQLTVNELRFLYQIDRKIEGFGDKEDPRIKEILKNRNEINDYTKIFNCREDQIATSMEELNDETVVLLGDFIAKDFQNESLPVNLKFIKGNAHFGNSKIKSLENLEVIEGNVSFFNSEVEDIGKLKRIGGHAFFINSKIKTLKNLEEIEGYADFRNSEVEDLGNLKRIGGYARFGNSKIKTLKNLEEIEEYADFEDSEVEDLGNLKRIGRFVDFRNSKIKSLKNLEVIEEHIFINHLTPNELVEEIIKKGWSDKIRSEEHLR